MRKLAEEEEAARIEAERLRKLAEKEEAARIEAERLRKLAEKEEAARIEAERLGKLAEIEEAARIEEERLRKLAEESAPELESSPLHQAWSILMDGKKHKVGSDLPSLLDELGLEDAEYLADLSAENVPRIAALLKDIPRNMFLQLVTRAAPAPPPAPA